MVRVALPDDAIRDHESRALCWRSHGIDLRRRAFWKVGPACLELLLQLAERAGPAAPDEAAVLTVRAWETVDASNIRPLTRKAEALHEVARRIGQQARREALCRSVDVRPAALFGGVSGGLVHIRMRFKVLPLLVLLVHVLPQAVVTPAHRKKTHPTARPVAVEEVVVVEALAQAGRPLGEVRGGFYTCRERRVTHAKGRRVVYSGGTCLVWSFNVYYKPLQLL